MLLLAAKYLLVLIKKKKNPSLSKHEQSINKEQD